MPKYFLTKTWGFKPSEYPLLGFNSDGALRSYLKSSDNDSWVLIAAINNENATTEQQGRLLGAVKLGRNQVDSEAVLNRIGTEINSSERDKEGRYKWPYGLPMLEAYSFNDSPRMKDIFGSGLAGFAWVTSARDLEIDPNTPNDITNIIDNLPKSRCKIHEIPEFERERYLQDMLNSGNTGPGPSNSRSGSEASTGKPVVYRLSLEGKMIKDISKIGYTTNINRRLKELNKGLITSITGYSWKLEEVQPHTSSLAAFTCEQLIHKHLQKWRVLGQSEIYQLSERKIASIFRNIVCEVEYMYPEIQALHAEKFEQLLQPDAFNVQTQD